MVALKLILKNIKNRFTILVMIGNTGEIPLYLRKFNRHNALYPVFHFYILDTILFRILLIIKLKWWSFGRNRKKIKYDYNDYNNVNLSNSYFTYHIFHGRSVRNQWYPQYWVSPWNNLFTYHEFRLFIQ